MSKDNAMDIIEQERVKELYMEGFRLNDLKRWHKGFERKPQDQSLSNGSSLKVEKTIHSLFGLFLSMKLKLREPTSNLMK